MQRVQDIKQKFINKLNEEKFVIDKTGVKTVEILAESFIADKEAIFGTLNREYINREIEWYKSQSLYVKDIPGGPPQIWQQVSSSEGKINSNYGWCIFSYENGSQYENVRRELFSKGDTTRRAEMIYTRPSMWTDYCYLGMSDFMCTDSVQYFIREDKLYSHVRMRSQDVVFGFKNDKAWQDYVVQKLLSDLNEAGMNLTLGDMYWTVGSLHVYERHFHLIKE